MLSGKRECAIGTNPVARASAFRFYFCGSCDISSIGTAMREMIGIEGRKYFRGAQPQSREARLIAGGEKKTHRIRFAWPADVAEPSRSSELPIPLDEQLFGKRMKSHVSHPLSYSLVFV
jgi:hypothetical protein